MPQLPIIEDTTPNFLYVEDCEPLSSAPPPPNCSNVITMECHSNSTRANRTFQLNLNSNSSNDASCSYNATDNTIYIDINDSGANNGAPVVQSFDYEDNGHNHVFVEAKKNGEKVGKAKHKITYGRE